MIIVLQHPDTLSFADREGCWVTGRTSAFEFHTTYEVLLFSARHGLSHAQMCFEFNNRALNFAVPVSARSDGGSGRKSSRKPADNKPAVSRRFA